MFGFARWSCRVFPTLLLALLPVHGNIGDTLDLLRHHYGSALGASSPYLFQHEGFSICVYLDGDHSAMEVFLRDSSLQDKKDFSGDDINKLLENEGEGQRWHNLASTSGHPVWIREDKTILATFNPDQKILTVMMNAK